MSKTEYSTEQRRLVMDHMDEVTDRYETVDEVYEGLRASGCSIGRTTVYRTLEKLAAEGAVSKVTGARGSAAGYRRLDDEQAPQGQLLCIECGRAYPLDCSMLQEFAGHVHAHHGFLIEQSRTVLCGICASCQEKNPAAVDTAVPASGAGHDHCDRCACGHHH